MNIKKLSLIKNRKNKLPKLDFFDSSCDLSFYSDVSWYDKIEPTLQTSLLSQVHNGGEKWRLNKIDPKKLQATNGQKWWIAVIIGFLFFVLASPSSFKISNKFFKLIYFPNSYSKASATLFGLFIHMLLFIIIIRVILW